MSGVSEKRMLLNHIFLAACGGAIGSAFRYTTGALILRGFGPTPGWPWGTFTVNLLGCFLMGILVEWMALRGSTDAASWRVFLATGVLGGFTTFSAFSLETVLFIERKAYLNAALYSASSVLLGIVMVFAGLFFMRKVLM